MIDGFDIKFTGENILGVSVDPASASGFLPVTGTFQGNTHLGLQLLSNNEIQVDVTGDLPLLGDRLILDLSFATVAVPGPIAGAGLPGLIMALGLLAWRKETQRRCARSLIKALDRISERPPRGGLSNGRSRINQTRINQLTMEIYSTTVGR